MNDHPPAPTSTPAASALVRHFPAIAAFTPQALVRRFDRAAFRERLIRHFKRWTLVYLLAALAAAWSVRSGSVWSG